MEGTDSIDDEEKEENICHSSPLPLTQVMPVCVVGQDEAWDSNLKVNQVIVKSVFSRVLKWEEIIDVLKKKVFRSTEELDWVEAFRAYGCLGEKNWYGIIIAGYMLNMEKLRTKMT